jgi:hypothetical protein
MPGPKPESNESQSDFMHRCVPFYMDEGKPQKQCVAMCMSIYKRKEETDALKVKFDESQHPRESDGKFTDKEGGGSSTPSGAKKTYSATERLEKAFGKIPSDYAKFIEDDANEEDLFYSPKDLKKQFQIWGSAEVVDHQQIIQTNQMRENGLLTDSQMVIGEWGDPSGYLHEGRTGPIVLDLKYGDVALINPAKNNENGKYYVTDYIQLGKSFQDVHDELKKGKNAKFKISFGAGTDSNPRGTKSDFESSLKVLPRYKGIFNESLHLRDSFGRFTEMEGSHAHAGLVGAGVRMVKRVLKQEVMTAMYKFTQKVIRPRVENVLKHVVNWIAEKLSKTAIIQGATREAEQAAHDAKLQKLIDLIDKSLAKKDDAVSKEQLNLIAYILGNEFNSLDGARRFVQSIADPTEDSKVIDEAAHCLYLVYKQSNVGEKVIKFDESQHPRDADGKFTDAPGDGTSGDGSKTIEGKPGLLPYDGSMSKKIERFLVGTAAYVAGSMLVDAAFVALFKRVPPDLHLVNAVTSLIIGIVVTDKVDKVLYGTQKADSSTPEKAKQALEQVLQDRASLMTEIKAKLAEKKISFPDKAIEMILDKIKDLPQKLADNLASKNKADFDETKHPRASDGKFTDGPGDSGTDNKTGVKPATTMQVIKTLVVGGFAYGVGEILGGTIGIGIVEALRMRNGLPAEAIVRGCAMTVGIVCMVKAANWLNSDRKKKSDTSPEEMRQALEAVLKDRASLVPAIQEDLANKKIEIKPDEVNKILDGLSNIPAKIEADMKKKGKEDHFSWRTAVKKDRGHNLPQTSVMAGQYPEW